ncbi:hypothetical protein AAIH37_35320, partial [Pseudomonas aeruginosa]|uniref:hypothetical protein n=1 Tax=Pseudomonas aeruginosa TaxID=287 RepID=UPI0031B7C3DF
SGSTKKVRFKNFASEWCGAPRKNKQYNSNIFTFIQTKCYLTNTTLHNKVADDNNTNTHNGYPCVFNAEDKGVGYAIT